MTKANHTESGEIILIDLEDRQIGTCEKLRTHREHRLHRAFSLFLVNPDGQMLLQQRAEGKYHSGGLWCNACCSHPRAGEALAEAVPRRAAEELGCSVPQAEELFQFVYYQDYGDLAEYELDHVFLAQAAGPFSPDPEEIQALRWIAPAELEAELLAHPDRFAAWFLIAAPRVLQMLRSRQDGGGQRS